MNQLPRMKVNEGTLRDVEAGYHLPPSHITDPKIILDLGANVGFTMIDYLTKYSNAFVLGVELDFRNVSSASKAVRHIRGERSQIVHAAIWDRDGYCDYVGDHHNAYLISGEGTKVRCFTLDSFIAKYMPVVHIDFVKFDIEGAERSIFKLGGQWPSMVGSLSAELHNYEYDEAAEDLAALGYENIVKVFNHPTSCLQAWH